MSAADDFNKILFADAVLDLLAAKVVERLAATGGGQDFRLVCKRDCDCHSLLFSTRHLCRVRIPFMLHAN